jgi:hypothetical protein
MQKPEPSAEHRLLLSMVGTWDFESECDMGPEQEPMKQAGVETVRALGEVWVVSEWVTNDARLGEHRSLMTLGFDPAQERFVGSFHTSMMPFLWVYNGAFDSEALASGRQRIVLDTTGPDFSGAGGMAPYQDIFEFVDEQTRTLTSLACRPSGEWVPFMRTVFRRRPE